MYVNKSDILSAYSSRYGSVDRTNEKSNGLARWAAYAGDSKSISHIQSCPPLGLSKLNASSTISRAASGGSSWKTNCMLTASA